jgi:hypothetical protein
MTSRSGYLVMTLVVLAAMLAMTSVAFAVVDEFGGGSFSAAYAPYTAGPVVTEEEAYAPYTAGPVVREEKAGSVPYAPYTAGPVVGEEFPYAPYTAGPVVKEEAPPERIGNYLLR